MNQALVKIADQDLHLQVQDLATQERRLTKIVIEHIAEVDRRKLFLKMAYPSLYEYLTRGIGYSEGAAQRRIDAARLLLIHPQMGEQIAQGTLQLSQVSKVQRICRQIKKDTGTRVTAEKQKTVLGKIQNQNAKQTDLILAQEFNVKLQNQER